MPATEFNVSHLSTLDILQLAPVLIVWIYGLFEWEYEITAGTTTGDLHANEGEDQENAPPLLMR